MSMINSYRKSYSNGPRHLDHDEAPPSLITPYQSGSGTDEDEDEMALLQRLETMQQKREAGGPAEPQEEEDAPYEGPEEHQALADLLREDEEKGLGEEAPATGRADRFSHLAVAKKDRQGGAEGEGLEEEGGNGFQAGNSRNLEGAGASSPATGSDDKPAATDPSPQIRNPNDVVRQGLEAKRKMEQDSQMGGADSSNTPKTSGNPNAEAEFRGELDKLQEIKRNLDGQDEVLKANEKAIEKWEDMVRVAKAARAGLKKGRGGPLARRLGDAAVADAERRLAESKAQRKPLEEEQKKLKADYDAQLKTTQEVGKRMQDEQARSQPLA